MRKKIRSKLTGIAVSTVFALSLAGCHTADTAQTTANETTSAVTALETTETTDGNTTEVETTEAKTTDSETTDSVNGETTAENTREDVTAEETPAEETPAEESGATESSASESEPSGKGDVTPGTKADNTSGSVETPTSGKAVNSETTKAANSETTKAATKEAVTTEAATTKAATTEEATTKATTEAATTEAATTEAVTKEVATTEEATTEAETAEETTTEETTTEEATTEEATTEEATTEAETEKPDDDSDVTLNFRLNKRSIHSYVGETAELKTYDANADVTFTSSDSSVASVSADGVVRMNSIGDAVITATCGDASATCKVSVAGLNADQIELNVGETFQFKMENSSAIIAFWTSSDTSVATVKPFTGKVTAKHAGVCTITYNVYGHKISAKVLVYSNTCNVTYHCAIEDAEVPEAQVVDEGTMLADSLKAEIALDGYRFDGWYLDEEFTTKATDTAITADVDLYAKLTKLWNVTYHASVEGVEVPESQVVDEGTMLADSLKAEIALDGYRFDGWYLDEKFTTKAADAEITADVDLYAKLTKLWNVTYHASVADAEVPEAQVVDEGTMLADSLKAEIALDGYRFDGWYLDEKFTTKAADAEITADVDLYAKLTKLWNVTYHASVEGAEVPESQVVDEGTMLADSLKAEAELEGYTFEGWYLDEELTTKATDTAITADVDLYAKLDKIPVYYTVSYYMPSDLSASGAVLPKTESVLEGTKIDDIAGVKEGAELEGYSFVGWYTNDALTESYADDAVIDSDLSLYAYMMENEMQITKMNDHYGVQNVSASYEMILSASSAADIKNNVTLVDQNRDQDEAVKFIVTATDTDGQYAVVRAGGFSEGHSYQLTVDTDNSDVRIVDGDGEVQNGACKLYNITVHKDEVANLELDDNIIYIKKSAIGDFTGVLADGVLNLSSDGTNAADYTGSFTYEGGRKLEVGDLVCLYTGKNPSTLTVEDDGDMSDENSASYVKIIAVNGTTYTYDAADFTEVMNIPDVIPMTTGLDKDGDDTNDSMTVSETELKTLWASIDGYSGDGQVSTGDILVICDGDTYVRSSSTADYTLAKVTAVTDTDDTLVITYQVTDEAAVEYGTEVYQTQELDIYDTLTEEDKEEIKNEVKEQAIASEFVQDSAVYLTSHAVRTDVVQTLLGATSLTGLTADDITFEDTAELLDGDGEGTLLLASGEEEGHVEIENLQTVVDISDDLQHYEDKTGVRVVMGITFEVVITPNHSEDDEEKKIKIEVAASFAQEVMVNLSYDGDGGLDIWSWSFDYDMTTSVDLGSYTGIAVSAKVYTSEDKDFDFDDDDAEKYAGDYADYVTAFADIGKEIKEEMDQDEQDKKADELAEGDTETKTLVERYRDMLQNETDYLEIFKIKILETETRFLYGTCVLKLEIKFVFSADVNLSLGMTLESAIAKTYGFHAEFSSDDGMKQFETFSDDYENMLAFEGYALGKIGLRAGLNITLTIGIITTDLCSAELSGEAGLFAKLYAMAYYKVTNDTDPQFTGEFLLDFGWYAELNAKFQIWNDTWKKEYELISVEDPLYYFGSPMVILGFHDATAPEPTVSYNHNDVIFTFDKSVTLVDALDLREGTYYGGLGDTEEEEEVEYEEEEEEDDDDAPVDKEALDFGYPIDINDFDEEEEEETEWSKFWADLADITDVDQFFDTVDKIEAVAPYSTAYNFDAKVSITESDGEATATYDPETNSVTLTPGPTTRMVKGQLVLTYKYPENLGKYMSSEETIISRTMYFEWSVDEGLTDVTYHYNNADDDTEETVYTREQVARSGYELNSKTFFNHAEPVREGYTFIGWANHVIDPMDIINSGITVSNVWSMGSKCNDDIHFYAVWVPDTIYVNGVAKYEDGRFSEYPYTGDAVGLKDVSILTGSFNSLPTWVGVNVEFRWNEETSRYELYYDDVKADEMAYIQNPNTSVAFGLAAKVKDIENKLTSYRASGLYLMPDVDMDTLTYGVYNASGETNVTYMYATRCTVTVEPGYTTDDEAVEIEVPYSASYRSLLAMTEFTREGYYIAGFKNVDTGEKVQLSDYILSDAHLEIIWKINQTGTILADYYLVNDDGSLTALETGRTTENVPTSKVFKNSEEYDPYTLDAAYTADGQTYVKIVGNVENGGDATAAVRSTAYTADGSAIREWTYQSNGSTTTPTHITVYFVEKTCNVTFVDELNDITFTKTLKAGTSLEDTYKAELQANYLDAKYVDTDWYYLKETDATRNGRGYQPEKTEITDDGAQVLIDYDDIVIYKEAKAATVTVNLYQMDENGEYSATPSETNSLTLENAATAVTILGNINTDSGSTQKTDKALNELMSGYRNTYYTNNSTAFVMDHVSLNMGDMLISDTEYTGATFWSDLNSVKFGEQPENYTINVYVKRLPVTYTFNNVPVVENGEVTDYNGTVTVNSYTGVKALLPVSDAENVTSITKFMHRSGADAVIDEENGTIVCESCGSRYSGSISITYSCKWILNTQPVTIITRGYYRTSETVYYPVGQEVEIKAPIAATIDVSVDQASQTVTLPEQNYSKTTYVYFTYEHAPYTITLNVNGQETQVKCSANTALGKGIAEAYGDDPVMEGYEFVGWTEKENSEADLINNGWAVTEDYYLYALFKKISIVNLSVNGEVTTYTCEPGVNTLDFIEETFGTVLPEAGLTFVGWSTVENDLTTLVSSTDTVPYPEITLYAAFTSGHLVTVINDGVETSFIVDEGTTLADAYKAEFGSAPTKEGYVFFDYTTVEGDLDTAVDGDAEVTQNLTVYTYFGSRTLPIVWDANDGTVISDGPTEAVDGQETGAPELKYEDLYLGYFVDQYGNTYNADGTTTFDRTKYKTDTQVTLKAVWKAKTTELVLLVFDENGQNVVMQVDNTTRLFCDHEYTLAWYVENTYGWKDQYTQYLDPDKYEMYKEWSDMVNHQNEWEYDENTVLQEGYLLLYLRPRSTEE